MEDTTARKRHRIVRHPVLIGKRKNDLRVVKQEGVSQGYSIRSTVVSRNKIPLQEASKSQVAGKKNEILVQLSMSEVFLALFPGSSSLS
jgi:hypothetical protein